MVVCIIQYHTVINHDTYLQHSLFPPAWRERASPRSDIYQHSSLLITHTHHHTSHHHITVVFNFTTTHSCTHLRLLPGLQDNVFLRLSLNSCLRNLPDLPPHFSPECYPTAPLFLCLQFSPFPFPSTAVTPHYPSPRPKTRIMPASFSASGYTPGANG